MSDLKLRHISIRNWMTIRQAELDFPEKGLVLVVGSNLASGGKLESVGSGKTALGEALSRTLVGVDGRYTNLGLYSHKGKGDSYVNLTVDLLNKPLRVEMGFKCPEMSTTGEAIRFQHGDDPVVERGKPTETRQELQSIIGVTPDLAQWSVYIDGDKLRFNKQSERQAVNLLMTALRQPSWDSYQKRASGVLNDAKAKLETTQGTQAAVRDQIANLVEAIATATDALKAEKASIAEKEKQLKEEAAEAQASITAKTNEVNTIAERQKAIKKRLQEIEDESSQEFARLEKEKAGVQTKLSQARINRTSLVEERAEARTAWNTATTALTDMQGEPENCPSCGKKWDKAHSAAELKSQTTAVAKAKVVYDAFAPKFTKVDAEITKLEGDINGVSQKITSLKSPKEANDLSYEYEQNGDQATETNSDISDLKLQLQRVQNGPDKSELNRKSAVLQERKAQKEQAQTSLEDAAQKLVEAQALTMVAQYWYDAFGPTGIPNMILSEAIAPLNEIARRISLLMTGGTIEITYDTSRELAKGGASSELVVNVKNKIGATRVEGSSKGEAGLTNLIIAETLSEVGSVSNRVGYRWYDEILNSQDQVVRRSILTYLKDLANRLGILVFVVDHHQEASSYADYVLLAEKSERGTEFSWR